MEKQQIGGRVSGRVQPFQTYYSINFDIFKTVLGTTYSNILISSSSSYWIASRTIQTRENYCEFAIQSINYGTLSTGSTLSSAGNGGGSSSKSLFPIVSLDYKLITLEGSNFKVNL